AVSPLLYYAMQNLKLTRLQCRGAQSVEWQSAWFHIATETLPYLDPARAERLVHAATDGGCEAPLSPTDRAWTDLYLAAARRDAAGLAAAAGAILTGDAPLAGTPQRAYVATAGMLGLLRSGRPHEAVALWREHGETQLANFGTPPYTRLVLQLAGSAAN
ncbi:MAG: hypothetical protein ACE5G3_11345, partial [Gammaproteobacteria bacterium]